MRLNVEDCLLFQKETEYLRKKISAVGVQPSRRKVERAELHRIRRS